MPAWWRRTFGDTCGSCVRDRRSRIARVQSAVLGAFVMLISNLAHAMLTAFGNRAVHAAARLEAQRLRDAHRWSRCSPPGSSARSRAASSQTSSATAGSPHSRRSVLAGFYLAWSLLEPHWAQHAVRLLAVLDRAAAHRHDDRVAVRAVHGHLVDRDRRVAVRDLHGAREFLVDARASSSPSHATEWFTNPASIRSPPIIQASLVLLLPFIDPKAARRTAAT